MLIILLENVVQCYCFFDNPTEKLKLSFVKGDRYDIEVKGSVVFK